MAKNQKNNSGFISTEDWLPIIDIKNGMIEVKGPMGAKQVVTGVRIEPKNIFISDSQTQTNTIYGLRDFYNTIDFEFWLICCDRPVDINLYRSELEIMYAQEDDPSIRKMINEDITKCDQFVGPEVNAVDTEFYILFKDNVKDHDITVKKIHSLISNLAAAGIKSRQVSDEDLRVMLDSFFNDSFKTEYGVVMSNV